MKDSNFILDRFVEKLYFQKDSLKDILIIVPTARVGSYVLGSLAKKLKIFPSPMILSLDNFILSFAPIQKDINKYKKDDILILFYIYSKLQRLRSKYLKPSSIDKIYQLFSLMDERSLDTDIFLKIKEILQESPYQSDSDFNYIIEKLSEIESLYSEFESLPIKTSSFIKKIALDSFINTLETTPNILEKYYSSIYIISDHYPSLYSELISLLEKKNNVFFIKESNSNLLSFDSYDQNSISITNKDKKIKTYFFNSFIQECFFITKKISHLISSGISPSKICVVLLDEKKYTPVLKDFFKKFGILSNFTSATSVKNSSLSNWISDCLTFKIPKDDSNAFLYKFLTHPLSIAILAFNNQNLFHNNSTQYSIEEFFNNYTIDQSYLILSNIYSIYLTNKYSNHLYDKNSSIYNLSQQLFSYIFSLDKNTHSYLDFYKTFDVFYKNISPYIPIIYKNDPSSLKTWEAFQSFIDYLKTLDELIYSDKKEREQELKTNKLTMLDINFLFSEFINKSLYWDSGSSLKGVQILKLPETSYYPFTKTFILGCSEQNDFSFSEGLFPSFIEGKLNLNKNQELKNLNSNLFSLLFNNSSSIEISFSQDELLYFNPHKYLQILDSKNLLYYINLKELKIFDKNINTTTNPNKTTSSLDTPIQLSNSYIKTHILSRTNISESILEDLSPSFLQNLIDCPYKFILSKYIKDYSYPSSNLLPKDEGKLVHKILEQYIQGLPSIEKENRKSYILSLLEKYSSPSFKKKDLYFHLKNFALDKFLDFINNLEALLNTNLTTSKTEFKLPTFSIELPKLTIKLTGIIDRLDTIYISNKPIYLITDYKTSSRHIPVSDTKSGKICQLILYTHALNNLAISGYWNVKDGGWKTHLCSQELSEIFFPKKKDKDKTSDINPELKFLDLKPSTASSQDCYKNLIDNIEERLSSIKENDCFYMDLESCPCNFSKICKNYDT